MSTPLSPSDAAVSKTLPMEGMRVVDFTTALSGPFATQTFGDLGADVIKVERPSGDDSRSWGPPFVGEAASYFLSINRNKRSIALDLKNEEDRSVALELIKSADVVIENYRPGVADRLGIGYAAARELNPSVVYCSISGYGADQPPKPGYDQVVQATSGWMSLTGMPDAEPLRTGVPVGDVASGMNAVQAVLAALLRRERTGKGALVDIAMQDTLVSMLAYQAGRYFATGVAPGRNGNHHPTVAPYGCYRTMDGNVVIAVGNNTQFTRLCETLDLPGLLSDADFRNNVDRCNNRDKLDSVLNARTAAMTSPELVQALEVAGVPGGPIRDLKEVFEDPATASRGLVLTFPGPSGENFSVPGGSWHLDGQHAAVHRPPPALGEHDAEIRAELLQLTFPQL